MSRIPTLHAAITGTLELALNRALELDPAGRRDLLRALAGPVCFQVSEPVNMALCLQGTSRGVTVSGLLPDDPALVIAGRPLALAALALGDDEAIHDGRLTVEGDTGLAQQFQQALANLDPDWEAALAGYTGDIPAHFIGQRIRSGVRWSRQAMGSISASVEEYIHEETGALPGRRELEPTFEAIDQLSLATERLEARIQRLEGTRHPNPDPSGTETP
ncbi:ubiquinone biosynthesis protein UbiJ [Marinobacter segnicrescens]|uniref:Ubiquinone biosynthesis accessory factor UbiJ n=1 Tax=Marinobacter segnicrescens TaxID=430453 RepID=A0A1H9ZSM7_9GAMM|nr:SCP2 sterol-binding domain-containing protein [Marinobacter segnicrescens]SES84716.1 ubiquinone biosynthesis protein UbiJ [Marinobacter segnicrescens]